MSRPVPLFPELEPALNLLTCNLANSMPSFTAIANLILDELREMTRDLPDAPRLPDTIPDLDVMLREFLRGVPGTVSHFFEGSIEPRLRELATEEELQSFRERVLNLFSGHGFQALPPQLTGSSTIITISPPGQDLVTIEYNVGPIHINGMNGVELVFPEGSAMGAIYSEVQLVVTITTAGGSVTNTVKVSSTPAMVRKLRVRVCATTNVLFIEGMND